MHPTIEKVTQRIIERSRGSREDYLQRMAALGAQSPQRESLSCGNLAHGFAACGKSDKDTLKLMNKANVAIVSAYNDMLSAHQPYHRFPDIIRQAAHGMGSVAQFAGGTPAMCDGVTQGQPGMELSLFSRDVIAMSTAVSLSHNMFDATMLLGICDKIVPGLLIGALSFGYLPTVLVPAGPMPSGLPNKEKNVFATSTLKARLAEMNCWNPKVSRTTALAPVPSTARRTATSCWLRLWGCTCLAPRLFIRIPPCGTL